MTRETLVPLDKLVCLDSLGQRATMVFLEKSGSLAQLDNQSVSLSLSLFPALYPLFSDQPIMGGEAGLLG